MPGEFEKQKQVWMVWPERTDTYRDGAKPAQQTFVNVATAISQFEPVTMLVSRAQYANARARLPEYIRVVEMSNNDAWALKQLQEMFPDRKVVGVNTIELIYGGGNIHCITQHQPAGIAR